MAKKGIRFKPLKKEDVLCDASSKSVLTFKPPRNENEGRAGVKVYSTDGTPLFQVMCDFQHSDKSTLKIKLTDLLIDQPCEIGLVGNWEQRDAYLWLDRELTGVREPVA